MIHELKKIQLEEQERIAARNALLSFMEQNPVRSDSPPHLHSLFTFLQPKTMPAKILASAMILILCGSGVSYAAEGSLPGDILYPIKVKVNEEVRARVAIGTEAKTAWEARRAERRLEEAETLAVQGKLDPSTRASLETNFEEHAEKANKQNTETTADAQENISAEFETSLRAHEQILEHLAEEKNESKVEVNALLMRIRSKAKTADDTRTWAEEKITTDGSDRVKMSAEGKINGAENTIARTKIFIQKINITAQGKTEAEAKLKSADSLLADAKAKLKIEAYKDAFILAGKASKAAEETRLALSRSQALKIDIQLDDMPGIDATSEIESDGDTTKESPVINDATNEPNLDVDLNSEINASNNESESKGKKYIKVGL